MKEGFGERQTEKGYLTTEDLLEISGYSRSREMGPTGQVALGYSQIPGVDYTDNFTPVVHDCSFRIALARVMVEKLGSLVMDVKTAFLYGEIDDEIFMKLPVGMEEIEPGSSSKDCNQLVKGIYGLCQAARQFWNKFVDTAKKEPFGFKVSPADPCMLFQENELGVCIIIMHVDDMLIIGKKEQI